MSLSKNAALLLSAAGFFAGVNEELDEFAETIGRNMTDDDTLSLVERIDAEASQNALFDRAKSPAAKSLADAFRGSTPGTLVWAGWKEALIMAVEADEAAEAATFEPMETETGLHPDAPQGPESPLHESGAATDECSVTVDGEEVSEDASSGEPDKPEEEAVERPYAPAFSNKELEDEIPF